MIAKISVVHFFFFLFRFASRLLAWILSRIVGASVGFRVGGWKCLRDVVVKFNKVFSCISISRFNFHCFFKLGAHKTKLNPLLVTNKRVLKLLNNFLSFWHYTIYLLSYLVGKNEKVKRLKARSNGIVAERNNNLSFPQCDWEGEKSGWKDK